MVSTREIKLLASALRRKAASISKRATRTTRRLRANASDYASRPPVVVISIPKSGTHLLHQIVTALPGTVDYGSFLATRASYRRRPRSIESQIRRLRSLAPGEILRSHLVYDSRIADTLHQTGALVVFLHRDPRDVAVSEAHYLTDFAPWHIMHREFTARSPEERVDLAIGGLPGGGSLYPDIGRRFERYEGWLKDADLVLRFEDLVDGTAQRELAVRQLVERYTAVAGPIDVAAVTEQALQQIDPSRSHTFREGRVGAFREELSASQLKHVEAVAGHILDRYGYS